MCLNKAKFYSEPTLGYSIGLPLLPKFVTVVHSSFYSYKTARTRTCSDQHLVECRLSFAEDVTTATKQKAPYLYCASCDIGAIFLFTHHTMELLAFQTVGLQINPESLSSLSKLIYWHAYHLW